MDDNREEFSFAWVLTGSKPDFSVTVVIVDKRPEDIDVDVRRTGIGAIKPPLTLPVVVDSRGLASDELRLDNTGIACDLRSIRRTCSVKRSTRHKAERKIVRMYFLLGFFNQTLNGFQC